MSGDIIHDIVLKAFSEFEIELIEHNRQTKYYKGHKEGSIFSFGYKITINVLLNGEINQILVDVESLAPFQIFSWGSNDDLKDRIVNYINSQIR